MGSTKAFQPHRAESWIITQCPDLEEFEGILMGFAFADRYLWHMLLFDGSSYIELLGYLAIESRNRSPFVIPWHRTTFREYQIF